MVMVYHGNELWLGKNKDYKMDIYCFYN